MSLSVEMAHRFADFSLEIAFDAPPGVTALFGRSGSGKTTIVNAVAGLMRPERGRVVVGGVTLLDTDKGIHVATRKRRVGYVFQDDRLFPHLSVEQNLLYGSWFASEPAREGDIAHIVELLGIGTLLSRRPAALSGGEKQRVAIGRALLSRPRLLLMDEPLAALDEARKAEILPYLERIRDEAEMPILYVSHSVAEIARLATTIVIVEAGRVVGSGPATQLLSDPQSARIFGVRSAGALLTGRMVAHHDDGLSEVRISGGTLLVPQIATPPGATVRLRIEAQDVILSPDRPHGLSALNILEGRITSILAGAGPGVMVQLRVGEDLLLARITRRSAEALRLTVGQTCYCVTKTVAVHPEDVGGGRLLG